MSVHPIVTTRQPGAFQALPVVDIAPLMARGAAGAAEVAAAIGRAAREVGFFYVTGHGCPPALIDRLVAQARRFFAQPAAAKMAVYIGNSRNHRGYVPPGEEVFVGGTPDTKEAFDLSLELPADDPDIQAGGPLLGPNQWPDLPGFAADVRAYYDAVFGIGRRLMQAFAVALGRPADAFDRFVTKPPSQLRLLHYPPNDRARDAPGIGAHTDYECFTLLLALAPGLEVMNGAGQWIDAPPIPGGFVVNIGDMLELWSGGAFVATTHRVRRVTEERYSFPLFFNVDYGTRVAPLDGPADLPAVVAGEHLYAQTVQTFRYLQERLRRGEIRLPEGAKPLASFGQAARLDGR